MDQKDLYKKISGRFDSTLFSWGIITISFLIGSIYIIQKGPILGNDSYGYMQMYMIRPAGYPLFLFVLRQLSDNYLMLAVVVQTIFNAVSIILFIQFISKTFDLKGFYLLFMLPLSIYYLVNVVGAGAILTESIAFPTFLILAIYLIRSILNRNLKDLFIALLINVVLVTIRVQFLFVFPLIFLIGIYIIFRNRHYLTAKYVALFCLSIPLAVLSGNLINRTYHYIFHDTFDGAEVNMTFVKIAMYISDEEDSELFEDERVRKIHSTVYDSIYSAGYNMNAFYENIYSSIPVEDRRRSDLIEHYHYNLNNIGSYLWRDFVTKPYNPSSEIEDSLVRARIVKKIASTILQKKWETYLYFIFSEIFVFGFSADRDYFIMFMLLYGLSFLGLIFTNRLGEIFFFLLTGHIGNLLLTALSNRVLPRYTFYLDFVILSMLIVTFIWILIKVTNKGELQKYLSKNI